MTTPPTIRDTIALLEALAARVPLGLDTPFACAGGITRNDAQNVLDKYREGDPDAVLPSADEVVSALARQWQKRPTVMEDCAEKIYDMAAAMSMGTEDAPIQGLEEGIKSTEENGQ